MGTKTGAQFPIWSRFWKVRTTEASEDCGLQVGKIPKLAGECYPFADLGAMRIDSEATLDTERLRNYGTQPSGWPLAIQRDPHGAPWNRNSPLGRGGAFGAGGLATEVAVLVARALAVR
jgi:hypothetical protein